MRLLWQTLLVSAVVVVVRPLWVFPAAYVPRALSRRLRERDPYPPWQGPALISYAGMRGAVSLAAALALPRLVDGRPFPQRGTILVVTFGVIVCTLVLQGLSLPSLIRLIRPPDDGQAELYEENKARLLAARAAIRRIDELAGEEWVRDETADRMRALYQYRERRFTARFDGESDDGYERRTASYLRLRYEALEAERGAIVELRNVGRISDLVLHRVERDIDLEVARLGLDGT
jgi:CPA1 family monovalent cation:H+ antiporter